MIVRWSVVTNTADTQWVGAVLPHSTTGMTSPLDIAVDVFYVSLDFKQDGEMWIWREIKEKYNNNNKNNKFL